MWVTEAWFEVPHLHFMVPLMQRTKTFFCVYIEWATLLNYMGSCLGPWGSDIDKVARNTISRIHDTCLVNFLFIKVLLFKNIYISFSQPIWLWFGASHQTASIITQLLFQTPQSGAGQGLKAVGSHTDSRFNCHKQNTEHNNALTHTYTRLIIEKL